MTASRLKALLLGLSTYGARITGVRGHTVNSRKNNARTNVVANRKNNSPSTSSVAMRVNARTLVPKAVNRRAPSNASSAMVPSGNRFNTVMSLLNPATIANLNTMINKSKKEALNTARSNLPPNYTPPQVNNRVFVNNKVNNAPKNWTFNNTVASFERRVQHARRLRVQHQVILKKANRFTNKGSILKTASNEFTGRGMNKVVLDSFQNSWKTITGQEESIEANASSLARLVNSRGGLMLNSNNKSLANFGISKTFSTNTKKFIQVLDKQDLKREEVKILGIVEGKLEGYAALVQMSNKKDQTLFLEKIKESINIATTSAVPTDLLDLSQADLNFTRDFLNTTLRKPEVIKLIKYLAPGSIVPDKHGNFLLGSVMYGIAATLVPKMVNPMLAVKVTRYLWSTAGVMYAYGVNNTAYSRDIGTALLSLKLVSITGVPLISTVADIIYSIGVLPVTVPLKVVKGVVTNGFMSSIVVLILFAGFLSSVGDVNDMVLFSADMLLSVYRKLKAT
jgi:hypothetical protein